MNVLQTNVSSLRALTALQQSDRSLGQATQRLSSGQRVVSARDDAAGMAIGARLTSALNSSGRLIDDIGKGINFAQIAEGALQGVSDILQRMRGLAVQSASDTLGTSDRQALNSEYLALHEEIDRISRQTTAFGRHPLAPPAAAPVVAPAPIGSTLPIMEVLAPQSQRFGSGLTSLGYIPQGYSNVTITLDSFSADDDIQIFTADGKHLLGTPVLAPTDTVWSAPPNYITSAQTATAAIMTTANAFDPGAQYDGSLLPAPAGYHTTTLPNVTTYNGMTLRYSGDGLSSGGGTVEKVTIDQVTENLVVMVIGSGVFNASGTWTEPPAAVAVTGPFSTDTAITLAASLGQDTQSLVLKATPSDTETLGLTGTGIQTVDTANTSMTRIDAALEKVNHYRVQYGAWQTSLNAAASNLQVYSVHAAQSRSQIMDADYARESTRLAAQQLIRDAGTAILAQANQNPSQLLSLLKKD